MAYRGDSYPSADAERLGTELDNIESNGRASKRPAMLNGGQPRRPKHSIHSMSWQWAFLVLLSGCLLFYLMHRLDYDLPKVRTIHEVTTEPGRYFSGDRSRESLRRMTALGPRVVGDAANEIDTPAILQGELMDAKNMAHPSQSLLFEVQKGSGAYQLGFVPSFTNIYDNVQNVVAMLEGSNGTHSVLLNCHYDTVPASDGASDDAITCAVMLELIRVLVVSEQRLTHNLIFLFNGAEETPLQGSHLFFKHRWAPSARLVLNLEAAGLGGRSLLFQSGPENAWLFKYYARNAPHPHAQIVGEELFQNGAIPSDTDFRIFRDFFKIPGLDFAFCRNGYVYHTKYDSEKYIDPASHQHLGDNILALLRKLGHAPEVADMKSHEQGQMVYYDYLGWFLVRYSKGAGIAINIITMLISFFSVVIFIGRLSQWAAWIEFGYALGARIAGMLAVLLLNVTIAAILDGISSLAMPWYSNVWLIFPLYWCPGIAVYALVPLLVDRWREDKRGLSQSMVTQLNLVTAQVPWAIVLFIMTCAGSRSAAVFVLPLLSSALANLLMHLTPLYLTVHKWVWVYLIIHIPSLAYNLYLVLLGYMFFLPIMGRSGTINGDLYIAVVTSLFIIFVLSFAMPLVGLIRRSALVLSLLGIFAFIMVPISLASDVGHPYRNGPSDPAPQRYWIMHSDRQFFDESQALRRRETGYFVLNLDRNSPKTIPLRGRSISSLEKDCEEEMYCGLPLYMTRMIPLSPTSSWIPADPPIQPFPTRLSVESKSCTTAAPVMCTFSLALSGPDRMTLTFSPREGSTLERWDVPSEPEASGEWKGRPSYYLHIVRGEMGPAYKISLTFKVEDASKPIMDIGLAGNHIHHETLRTQEFDDFLKTFPDWTQMTGWISAYNAYVF